MCVAAFDDAGAADVMDIILTVEDTLIEGDANCDGSISADDVRTLSQRMFSSLRPDQCVLADANGDGIISAADLAALVAKL